MKILDFSLLLFLIPTCLGLDDTMIEFSVEYFSQRDVKFLCLLTCDKSLIQRKFTKVANNQYIAVEIADIGHKLDYRKVKRCTRQKYSNVGIITDINCNNTRSILTYASQEMLFNTPKKWLVIVHKYPTIWNEIMKNTSNNIKRNLNVFEDSILYNLNMSVDVDFTVAVLDDFRTINLYEVYNYGKIQGGKFKFINFAKWISREDLQLNYLKIYKYYRRWNFEEFKLRMVIVMSPLVKNISADVVTSRHPVPGITVFTRTSSTVLHAVSEIHNIRYEYIAVDRWVGKYDRNASAAVTNSLYFRNADISPVIRMNYFAIGYIDLIHPPLTSIETRYYYKIPTYGPGKFENQFLRPLSPGVWICVVAVGVLCILVLLMSSKIERRPSSMQFAVFSVVASFCQQFFEDNGEMATRKTTTASKMTILVTGVSCVLIYNYYTSSVVSWLLNGPPPSINSLRELLDSPLELIFEDIGYTRSWLQMPDYYYNKRNAKIEDELRQRKVLNKKKGELLVPLEKGIEMVKAGGFAYHTEVDSANALISRTFTQNELCELASLQSIEKTLLFACLQRDSPYKEFFVWSLLRLRERGIVSCIQARTRAPDVSCEGSVPRALALGGAAPAFILLATGYILGIAIMVIECISYRMQNRFATVRF